MANTNFYLTGDALASDNNGGGPRLGANGGPVYTTTDATVTAGNPSIVTDNSGSNWAGVLADDWFCWDIAGAKERRRVVVNNGDGTILVTPAIASVGASKAVNVCGAWATDLALTFLTTAYVDSGNNPPKLNIKGNASITLSTARATGTATVVVPIAIAGYSSTPGDLEAESWAASHTSAGFLTTTGYPTLTLQTNQLTTGNFNSLSCLVVTSTRSGTSVAEGINNTAYRVKVTNSANTGGVLCYQQGTKCNWHDCEFFTTGTSANACVGGGNLSYVYACRFSSVAGDCVGSSTAVNFFDCVFYGISTGKTGIKITNINTTISIKNCTFNGTSAGTGISVVNNTQVSPMAAVTNCHFTNLTTGVVNLWTTPIAGAFRNNRFRDCTPYTGWLVNAGVNDVTTDSDDATEYVDAGASPPDLHLKSGAYGLGVGLPIGTDIGAWQRETDYPAVGNVDVDDTSDGAAGTLVQPTEAQVELGVGFGASGTEFTGSLSAGGHVQARVRTGY